MGWEEVGGGGREGVGEERQKKKEWEKQKHTIPTMKKLLRDSVEQMWAFWACTDHFELN